MPVVTCTEPVRSGSTEVHTDICHECVGAAVRAEGEAATRGGGRLQALHQQSRHPRATFWPHSSASPPEAPVDPHRVHLHTQGARV